MESYCMIEPTQGVYPPQQSFGAIPYSPQTAFPPQQSFGEMAYAPQTAFPPQQSFGEMAYAPQTAFPPQQSFGEMAYAPQTAFPPQQSFGEMAYAPQTAFPPQDPFMVPQPYEPPRNLQATRAIINGLVSLVLSIFTFATPAGLAGLITSTLAIVCGFLGLKAAKQLPSNMGHKQAIIGMVLGGVAWLIVILALIIRATTTSG
jgi:hypothetical protein